MIRLSSFRIEGIAEQAAAHIGLFTPFRTNVHLIENAIREALIEEHQLMAAANAPAMTLELDKDD